MRALHVIHALWGSGGAERALATMLSLLREQGTESSVVSLYRRQGGPQATLHNQGLRVDVLPGGSWLGQVRTLRRGVRSDGPDVVQATLLRSCLSARIACVGLDVARLDSLVNTSHDPVQAEQLNIPRWKLELMRRIKGFTASYLVTHFLAITRTVAQEGMNQLGIAPERITAVPRGASAVFLADRNAERRRDDRPRLKVPMDAPALLNVGRQDHQMAQASLIRAFAQVRERLPGAILLIAGRDGDATPSLQQALLDTGLDHPSVRILGHRTDDLYVAADVFVFTSPYEGLGCSLIEAMGLSTPIIASDAPGIREVLDEDKYGIIVTRGNDDALAEAIVNLVLDQGLQVELGCRGRERFLRSYEFERVARTILDLYHWLAHPNHPILTGG
ncbi:MAG: glycosyltransferase family 4 protein [Armatimonadetes bacterium]|nr:glycosyltransferase family 4 protein [Armatimonadota bacterium]